jgi:indolepyruvate ferredoxin oxidoreductase
VKLYEGIRGFGHIKEAAYRQASDKQKTLLEQFRQQAGKRKVA